MTKNQGVGFQDMQDEILHSRIISIVMHRIWNKAVFTMRLKKGSGIM